jgi:hypothetical protein
MKTPHVRRYGRAALASASVLLIVTEASALPAFSRQTGESCSQCHVGGFGPQLTPEGMAFKRDGYRESDGKAGHIPLSAMLLGTYAHQKTDLPPARIPEHFHRDHNAALQEASVFLAGRLGANAGSFTQITYSDIERKTSLDTLDLRLTADPRNDMTLGLSLNNGPGVQDPFNSLAAWRFPYTSSEFAASPSYRPLLDGVLEGNTYGMTAQLTYNDSLYAEAGVYDSFSKGQLDTLNVEQGPQIHAAAPYLRVAWYNDDDTLSWHGGALAFRAKLTDVDQQSGPEDVHTSIGLDGGTQWRPNARHLFSLSGQYLHEHQDLQASFPAGLSDGDSNHLHELHLAGAWSIDDTWGLSASWIDIYGTRDDRRYAPVDAGGDFLRRGKPDSTGYTLQADWTPFGKEMSWRAPWANTRIGLQYQSWTRLDGASRNFDGEGRDAADEDTVLLFVWAAI